ncbi:unnamed protein product [Mesocestoides corti]|nr:unnamed protein product [Mesocestoides corti]
MSQLNCCVLKHHPPAAHRLQCLNKMCNDECGRLANAAVTTAAAAAAVFVGECTVPEQNAIKLGRSSLLLKLNA